MNLVHLTQLNSIQAGGIGSGCNPKEALKHGKKCGRKAVKSTSEAVENTTESIKNSGPVNALFHTRSNRLKMVFKDWRVRAGLGATATIGAYLLARKLLPFKGKPFKRETFITEPLDKKVLKALKAIPDQDLVNIHRVMQADFGAHVGGGSYNTIRFIKGKLAPRVVNNILVGDNWVKKAPRSMVENIVWHEIGHSVAELLSDKGKKYKMFLRQRLPTFVKVPLAGILGPKWNYGFRSRALDSNPFVDLPEALRKKHIPTRGGLLGRLKMSTYFNDPAEVWAQAYANVIRNRVYKDGKVFVMKIKGYPTILHPHTHGFETKFVLRKANRKQRKMMKLVENYLKNERRIFSSADIYAGGPGSGCDPDEAARAGKKCGRPSEGKQEQPYTPAPDPKVVIKKKAQQKAERRLERTAKTAPVVKKSMEKVTRVSPAGEKLVKMTAKVETYRKSPAYRKPAENMDQVELNDALKTTKAIANEILNILTKVSQKLDAPEREVVNNYQAKAREALAPEPLLPEPSFGEQAGQVVGELDHAREAVDMLQRGLGMGVSKLLGKDLRNLKRAAVFPFKAGKWAYDVVQLYRISRDTKKLRKMQEAQMPKPPEHPIRPLLPPTKIKW